MSPPGHVTRAMTFPGRSRSDSSTDVTTSSSSTMSALRRGRRVRSVRLVDRHVLESGRCWRAWSWRRGSTGRRQRRISTPGWEAAITAAVTPRRHRRSTTQDVARWAGAGEQRRRREASRGELTAKGGSSKLGDVRTHGGTTYLGPSGRNVKRDRRPGGAGQAYSVPWQAVIGFDEIDEGTHPRLRPEVELFMLGGDRPPRRARGRVVPSGGRRRSRRRCSRARRRRRAGHRRRQRVRHRASTGRRATSSG